MKLLYASTSLAFTQLVRLTLDREAIEYFCSDADSAVAGLAGPMAGVQSRIYVLHEHDWARAVALIAGLLPAKQAASESSPGKMFPVWLITAGAVLAVFCVGAALTR